MSAPGPLAHTPGGLGAPGPTATNVAGGTSGKFWVAGGGGGQAFQPTTGAKGGGPGGPYAGGGNASPDSNQPGQIGDNGVANTGGGAGGSYANSFDKRGGNGGSGLVLIAYDTV